jgi:hypothetical protein
MRILIFVAILGTLGTSLKAQSKELKINFNESGSQYLKANFTAQVWTRYTDNNPGTTINGVIEKETFDIGLRRVRLQLMGKVSDKVFVYTQFGINNAGYNTARKPGLFFHDVVTEYQPTEKLIHIGTGLTGWTGFSRFAAPSAGNILGYDAPLYQQSTNDVNDQFLRKLSVYAKGKINKFDYRLVLSKPMIVDASVTAVKPLNVYSDFSYNAPKLQSSGYLMYQFFDEESNTTPYMVGTYLGKKKVLTLGAGFQYQPNAMWYLTDTVSKTVVHQKLLNVGVDVFFEYPIKDNGSALTVYAAASKTDYGKNYIRNNGVLNPASASSGNTLSGGGNAFAMYGTGNTFFTQVGYLLPKKNNTDKNRIQPYADITLCKYDRLKNNIAMWDVGFNWLIEGQLSKVSLNYQSRPIVNTATLKQTTNKGMFVVQFQIAI